MFQSDLFPASEQLPSEPLAFAIGTRIAALLASGRHLTRADISGLFAKDTGALDRGSAWTIDDYNNATEIGAMLWLCTNDEGSDRGQIHSASTNPNPAKTASSKKAGAIPNRAPTCPATG